MNRSTLAQFNTQRAPSRLNRWLGARCAVIERRVFPFAAVMEAMAYLETGHAKGKVVLAMR